MESRQLFNLLFQITEKVFTKDNLEKTNHSRKIILDIIEVHNHLHRSGKVIRIIGK